MTPPRRLKSSTEMSTVIADEKKMPTITPARRSVWMDSALPAEAIACVTGPGSALGRAICTDDRVRKISFTGSYETGDAICKLAGMKRVPSGSRR